MKTMTSAAAQNRFGEMLDAAQREPVTITRRGRTVAFVVSADDLRDLVDSRATRQAAAEAYAAYRAQVGPVATAAASALTDAEVERLVREARGKR